MTTNSTDPIVREIHIEAEPETVFAFFTDPDKLTRWLATEATLEPWPGGRCLQVHAGLDPDTGPFHMQGTFLEVTPPTRVAFSWGFTEPEIGAPPGSSLVEVTLTPVGGGTHVRLVHRGLPAPAVDGHAGGWTHMLGRLARAVPARHADR